MNETPLKGIRACVFDAYGTLFDYASAAARCSDLLGSRQAGLSALWREKQLQYTWLRALQGRHADFWQVTGDALDFAMATLGLAGSAYADPPESTFRLPRGVRRSSTGRYTTAMCDPKDDGINCLGRWLLPPDWQPGMPLPERIGGVPQGPFGPTPMGPSDVLTGYSIPSSSAANGKIDAKPHRDLDERQTARA